MENRSHVVPKTGFQDGGDWTRIVTHNYHFGLVYDVIYKFLGMEAKNHKFGMFFQQCYPSVAPSDAGIRPRNASQIHTCHLLRRKFVYISIWENREDKSLDQNF